MVYMGSKRRIKKKLVPILQDYIDNNNVMTYIEPMVGGVQHHRLNQMREPFRI